MGSARQVSAATRRILARVPSRRRYRYRFRRLIPVGLAMVVAAVAGVWFGARHATAPAAAAPPRAPAVRQAPVKHVKSVAPERLLVGTPLLQGRLRQPLLAASAILVDATTGQVLWQLHPHERRHVASTTKIMTALLALRKLAPDDVVTVDPSVPRVPLVREGLRAGERVPAWKLFYSLLLYSGNDDALALAIAAGGDKWTFVRGMNAEARLLGLRDTHYSTPSGVVDADNYSSAWDLAALTRVAMRNPRFRRIVHTRIIHVSWAAPTYSKIYVNNNLMLTRYVGATGVKTGFTHKAGWCLVVSAMRGKVSLIAVVLDSGNMYADATRLLNLGFAARS
jgi:serine-type D-Ala-D-Ala carboxypeptidase (penicillin-binding protein 5/6)